MIVKSWVSVGYIYTEKIQPIHSWLRKKLVLSSWRKTYQQIHCGEYQARVKYLEKREEDGSLKYLERREEDGSMKYLKRREDGGLKYFEKQEDGSLKYLEWREDGRLKYLERRKKGGGTEGESRNKKQSRFVSISDRQHKRWAVIVPGVICRGRVLDIAMQLHHLSWGTWRWLSCAAGWRSLAEMCGVPSVASGIMVMKLRDGLDPNNIRRREEARK